VTDFHAPHAAPEGAAAVFPAPAESEARRRWMGVLGRASGDDLERAWRSLADKPAYVAVRAPETGMVMVRGRAGGTGAPFCLGEMTVTRCAVETADGRVGVSYLAGRDPRRAEIAAALDALLQDPARRATLLREVIDPLAAGQADARRARRAKVAATKVDFFTMVRGD